jgi:hypothetical protein
LLVSTKHTSREGIRLPTFNTQAMLLYTLHISREGKGIRLPIFPLKSSILK